MKVYTVVITGASGSVYGLRTVEQLLLSGAAVTLVATEAGAEVCAYETGFTIPGPDQEERMLEYLDRHSLLLLRSISPWFPCC